ncbi:MAG TPA: peptidylprolyl isomerase [Candidatus Kapabacteria bacterium]|nr:peptidylprolyl isomerase [Candidatus Kapabacteria bacterium]
MISTPYAVRITMVLAGACITLSACTKKAPDASPGSQTKPIDTVQLAPGAASAGSLDTAKHVDSVPAVPVATYLATISTSMGDIDVELYGNDAPKTVKNFVELARKKYYDGIAFHRVIPGFMVQTGDPNSRDMKDRSGWGQGGESIYGKTFEDELNPATPSFRRGYAEGVLAMANAGPNTNGSQFFIVLSAEGAAHLQPNYTIFGFVRNGMDVVRKIGETGRMGEQPEQPATIKTITVKPADGATATTADRQPKAEGVTATHSKSGEAGSGDAKAPGVKSGESRPAAPKAGGAKGTDSKGGGTSGGR